MKRAPMPYPQSSTPPQRREPSAAGLPEPLLQADTFARSASNLVTGGWANNIEAANAALFDRSPGDWLTHYKAALQDQLTRDNYDASHRPVAVGLGDAAGVGLSASGGFAAGARGSAALPIKMKGDLGEALSVAKTILKGDRPADFQVRTALDNGRKTVVDHLTANGINVEAKFGPWAKLSQNQKYAQQQFGSLYRVDHWLPEHVGRITAPLGPVVGGLLSWGRQHLNAALANPPEEDPSQDPAYVVATD